MGMVLLVGAAILAVRSAGAALPEVTVRVGGHTVTAEVAVTQAQRAKGLAGRERLAPDRGMLFVWPQAGTRRFWMKGTRIPLSVAFLDGGGTILNIQRMVPPPDDRGHVLRHYPSRGKARFALEVNRGWFKAHGITAGDRCRFRLPAAITGTGPLVVGRGSGG
jgi:hypothetical protein